MHYLNTINNVALQVVYDCLSVSILKFITYVMTKYWTIIRLFSATNVSSVVFIGINSLVPMIPLLNFSPMGICS